MKKLLVIVIALTLLLSSCKSTEKEGSPKLTFKDGTGEIISMDAPPKRVAVLFSSFAQIYTLAGGSVSISVGESIERGILPEGTVTVDESSGHNDIDLEALLAAEPDLVIGTADYPGQVKACSFCRENGIPAALFKVETITDYLGVLETFTTLTGDTEAYKTYGEDIAKKCKELIAEYKRNNPTSKNILFVRAGSSAKSTKAKGSEDHFACGMLKELGCTNIADSAPVLLDGLSQETVISAAPDYIFISTMGDEAAAAEYINSLFAQDGWKGLTAVKEGKYTILPKELFHYKPNHRFPEAYEILISCLSEV